jgi:hypothetical protein
LRPLRRLTDLLATTLLPCAVARDVPAGFALTLVDSLDMLAIVGDYVEFRRAVARVIRDVSFDRNVTVSVFEATIRVMGGLLSAHMLAEDRSYALVPWYKGARPPATSAVVAVAMEGGGVRLVSSARASAHVAQCVTLTLLLHPVVRRVMQQGSCWRWRWTWGGDCCPPSTRTPGCRTTV